MVYISFYFYLFLAAVLAVYYLLPLKVRWFALLAGSLAFYFQLSRDTWWIFGLMAVFSWGAALFLEHLREREGSEPGKSGRRLALELCIAVSAAPLVVTKNGNFVLISLLGRSGRDFLVPLGLSFYTMQIVAYLADTAAGKVKAQRNLAKYVLFLSFFPQIVQGPIPRYSQQEGPLFEGHKFDGREFSKGLQLIVWGFFLKLMLADKAAVIVNAIFDNRETYQGAYVWVAGALYSLQLYTDFLSCVCLAQGAAALFGIPLADNFSRPYGSSSVKEFWGRWHISLSSWLRDYIYIPLGGNRKGKFRRYVNLIITFAVSGVWHGAGYKYLFWGLMHGSYQIAGELTAGARDRICRFLGLEHGRVARRLLAQAGTFFWVMLAWIIFRADSLRGGLAMIKSMFTVYNPWIFFDDSLLKLGLSWKEWNVLWLSMAVLWCVGQLQKRVCLRDEILGQPRVIRWPLYIGAVLVIMVFGSYGYGFNASDFIYGGF